MDFFTKLLHIKPNPTKAGTSDASVPVASCDNQTPLELPGVVTAAPQPSKPPSSDHEQNIIVARNLVEELVNSASHTNQKSFDFSHGDSGGGIIYEHSPLTKFDNDDDSFSLCSLSLQSGSSLSLVPSLPDLLQSAKNFQNKNTDTDTDTTEYDTAPETDSASIQDIPFGDLISNSDFNISGLCRDLAKVTLDTSTNNITVTQKNTESTSPIQHDSDSGSFVDCDTNSDSPEFHSPSNKNQKTIVEDESNESFKSTSSFDSVKPNNSLLEQSSNSSKNYDNSKNCNETVVLDQTLVNESQDNLKSPTNLSNENNYSIILLNNPTKDESFKDEKGELDSSLPKLVYDKSTELSSTNTFEDPNKNCNLESSQSPDLKENKEFTYGKYEHDSSPESDKELLKIQSFFTEKPGSFSLNSTILISDSPILQKEDIHNNSVVSDQVSPLELKQNSVVSSQNLQDLNTKLINNFELQEEENRKLENENLNKVCDTPIESKNSDDHLEEKVVENTENKVQIETLEESSKVSNNSYISLDENKDQIKTPEESLKVPTNSDIALKEKLVENTDNKNQIETLEESPIVSNNSDISLEEEKDRIKTPEDSSKVLTNSDVTLEEKLVDNTGNKVQIETLKDSTKVSNNFNIALEEDKDQNKTLEESPKVITNSDIALEEKLVENTENKDQIETIQDSTKVSNNSDIALEENKDQIETLDVPPIVVYNSDNDLEKKFVQNTEFSFEQNQNSLSSSEFNPNDSKFHNSSISCQGESDQIHSQDSIFNESIKADLSFIEFQSECKKQQDLNQSAEIFTASTPETVPLVENPQIVKNTENKDQIKTLEEPPTVLLNSDKALEEKLVENTENKDQIKTLEEPPTVLLNSDKALEETFVENTENKDQIKTLEVTPKVLLNSGKALEEKLVENTENKDQIKTLEEPPTVLVNSDKALEEKFVENSEIKDQIQTSEESLKVSTNSNNAFEEKSVDKTENKDRIEILEESLKVSLNSVKVLEEKLLENTNNKDQVKTLKDSPKEENYFITQVEDIKNNTIVKDHNNSLNAKDNLPKYSLPESEKVIQELSTESRGLKEFSDSLKQSLDSDILLQDKNSSLNSIKKDSSKESPQIKKKEIIQDDQYTTPDIQNLNILEDVHLKSDLSENLPKDTRKPNVILVSELLNKTLEQQFNCNAEPLNQSTPKFELKDPNLDQRDSPNKFQLESEINRKATLVLKEGIFSPFKQIKSPLPVVHPGEDSFRKLNLVLNSVETEPQFNNILEICKRQQRSLETDEELPFYAESDFVEGEKIFGAHSNSDTTFELPNFEENRQYQLQAFDFDLISQEASRLSLTLKNDDQMNDGLKSTNSMADAIGSSATYTKRGSARGVSPAAANEDPFRPKSRLQNSPPRRVSGDRKSYPRANTKVESIDPDLISSTSETINQSEAGPETAAAVAAPNLGSDNAFKDPSAFEFLSTVGNSRSHHLRDLRKESLYVKFDPLVGNNPISQPASADIDNKSKINTLKEEPNANECHSPISSRINHTIQEDEKSISSTPRKNPAIDLIDKLILLSPSPIKEPAGATGPQTKDSHTQATPIKDREPNINIKQFESILGDNNKMKEELELVRDLLTKQEKDYEEALEEKEKMINSLSQRNKELEDKESKQFKINERMKIFLKEYEKSISNLTAEKEYDKQMYEADKEALIKDKEQAMGHLEAIEVAFADLHKKYERAKNVIDGFKKNEEVLKLHLVESKETIGEQEEKYELFKKHVFSQLESANKELDATKRSHQSDIAKLSAMLKKSEIKCISLQETLDQKVKENAELTKICDELIDKVN